MNFLIQRRSVLRRMAALCAGVILAAGPVASRAAESVAAGREVAKLFAAYAGPGQPSCAVGVMRDGRLTQAQAFGLADLERGQPLAADAVFNLASISKQFTAFALLLLQQDGKLSLDDPLLRHVPELAASAQGVTLRHLLHHTGGLRDYIELLTMRGRGDADGATIHESVLALARQRGANSGPNTEYDYSNTGYLLLGLVVARVSGQSLAEFSAERIFRPLGMKDTRIVDHYPDGIVKLARGYAPAGAGFRIDETAWEQVGDGQVHSNLQDLARWDENFYTAQLGGRDLIDQMHVTGVLKSGERIDYAAGLRISTSRGLPTVDHGGSWVGYRSQLLRFARQHVSVAVLCNRADANPAALAQSVAGIVLGAQMEPAAASADDEPAGTPAVPIAAWQPGDRSRYAGEYFSDEAHARCALYPRDSALVLEGCARGSVLTPGKPGEWVDADGGLRLVFPASSGNMTSFEYHSGGLRGLRFERIGETSHEK